MDTGTIGALSAVLGLLVGGTATAATSWMSQRTPNRSKQIKDEMKGREALYGEFISECAKLAVKAHSPGTKFRPNADVSLTTS